jgi:hypothetical protein
MSRAMEHSQNQPLTHPISRHHWGKVLPLSSKQPPCVGPRSMLLAEHSCQVNRRLASNLAPICGIHTQFSVGVGPGAP